MKAALSLLACALAAMVLASALVAQDKGKEVTLKGTILCAKCSLNETQQCQTAIQVKEGDKTVTYYFDDKGKAESYHAAICTDQKEGTVVGNVSERGGKKMIKPTKVEYAKK